MVAMNRITVIEPWKRTVYRIIAPNQYNVVVVYCYHAVFAGVIASCLSPGTDSVMPTTPATTGHSQVLYSQALYSLLTEGLNELAASQSAGKTPHNPVSENHFFSAWITRAIKQHRFDRVVLPTLRHWQQQARTQGNNAGLKSQFAQLAAVYGQVVDQQGQFVAIHKQQLTAVTEQLTDLGWQVTRDLLVTAKMSLKTHGQHSLVICPEQAKGAFDDNNHLIRPLSLYVRGDMAQVISTALSHKLLLFKVTEYKSKVKYHGEYRIYPANNGHQPPEL